MKVIDIDKLFDKYIEGYVYNNIGKIKAEEIENQIPVLYEKFGDEINSDLDGKTPNTYYRDFDIKELLDCLKKHIDEGVSVSDFLCEAIVSKKEEVGYIIEELKADYCEEYTAYLMNMLKEMGGEIPSQRYLQFVICDYPQSISELATEFLSENADKVKEDVITEFDNVSDEKRIMLTEILSNCKWDDRIFDILIKEFVKNQDNIPLYVSYLVKYGDDKALPFLMTAIESDKINYSDFNELRFAIESLGGEYNKKRDFTNDKVYKKMRIEKLKESQKKD